MQCNKLVITVLLLLTSVLLVAQNCETMPNPPKLPVVREDVREVPFRLRTSVAGTLADTWKPARKQTATFQADIDIEVLETLIVVESPDILWINLEMPSLKAKAGDKLLRYARLEEGFADLWINGCWYKDFDDSFVTEPDGGGCASANCAAKVTRPGHQTWWFHIKFPNGQTGWTTSDALDLSKGA
jgi:hypothetical protein